MHWTDPPQVTSAAVVAAIRRELVEVAVSDTVILTGSVAHAAVTTSRESSLSSTFVILNKLKSH